MRVSSGIFFAQVTEARVHCDRLWVKNGQDMSRPSFHIGCQLQAVFFSPGCTHRTNGIPPGEGEPKAVGGFSGVRSSVWRRSEPGQWVDLLVDQFSWKRDRRANRLAFGTVRWDWLCGIKKETNCKKRRKETPLPGINCMRVVPRYDTQPAWNLIEFGSTCHHFVGLLANTTSNG